MFCFTFLIHFLAPPPFFLLKGSNLDEVIGLGEGRGGAEGEGEAVVVHGSEAVSAGGGVIWRRYCEKEFDYYHSHKYFLLMTS